MKKYFYLFWWSNFNYIKNDLFIHLVNGGMNGDFAFKKVIKLSIEECLKQLEEINNTSKAYKQGYADGDYYDNSQNPYFYKSSPKEYKDYELGFEACKADKRKNWTEIVLNEFEKGYKQTEEKHIDSEPIDIEHYKKLLEQHIWKYSDSKDPKIYETGVITHNNLIKLASANSDFRRAYFSMKEKMMPSCGH
jgi:hypothetical protein